MIEEDQIEEPKFPLHQPLNLTAHVSNHRLHNLGSTRMNSAAQLVTDSGEVSNLLSDLAYPGRRLTLHQIPPLLPFMTYP